MATYYKARGTYNDRDLSASDAAKVAQYKQQYETAKAAGDTAGMNAAHAAAEQVRSGYGYSGGGDGSERIGQTTETYGGKLNTGTVNTSGGTRKNTGSSNNQNTAVSNAQAALSNAAAGAFNYQGVNPAYNASQLQEGLDMMKYNSQGWQNDDPYLRPTFALNNQKLAADYFPGATYANGTWTLNGVPLYDYDFSGYTGGGAAAGQDPLANAAAQMAGLNGYTATSPDGMTYSIGSEKGINFLTNAAAGETMTGGDGSQWTKNADGSVTITKNGRTYTYGGGGVQQAYIPTLVDQYGPQIAQSLSGEKYTIGSDTGLDFLYNGGVGTSIVGGDGSVWVKNADGSVNIYKNGQTYTIQGNPVGQVEMPEFTPFEQTEMGQSMWSGWQDLYDRLNNYQPFSYNPETDPLYLQYADSYTRGGQRAMTDVLGQLAARTGGLASSYAGSMAQQTYDNYMADLANKIPELQQLAYSMYVDDYNRQAGNYDRAYQKFADAYNRYNQDYLNEYNRYRDEVSDQQWNITNAQNQAADERSRYYQAQQWAAQLAQNQLENQRYEREYADQRADTQADRAIQTKAQLINMVQQGYIPTQEDAVLYGLTPTELAQYQKWANERNRQENSRYYGYYGY